MKGPNRVAVLVTDGLADSDDDGRTIIGKHSQNMVMGINVGETSYLSGCNADMRNHPIGIARWCLLGLVILGISSGSAGEFSSESHQPPLSFKTSFMRKGGGLRMRGAGSLR